MTLLSSPGDHLALFKVIVHGAAFDVDTYLASTGLLVDHVFHPADQPRGRPADTYWHGFQVRLGPLSLDADKQAAVAARYLVEHHAALAGLAAFKTSTKVVLLSPELPCTPCIATRAFSLPAALIVPAAELGFEVRFTFRLRSAENVDNARNWLSPTDYDEFLRELDPAGLRVLAEKIERKQQS